VRSFTRPQNSSQLYGVDLAGNLKGKGFLLDRQHLALPLREFAQQIRIGGNLTPRKYAKAYGIGHSATNVDQGEQIPGVVLLPLSMMIGDYDLEVRRQFPVRNEMPSCLAMIKSEQAAFEWENAAGRSTMVHQ